MANPTLSMDIFSDGGLRVENPVMQPPPSGRQFWRVPHDIERVNMLPEDTDYSYNPGPTKGPVRRETQRLGRIPEVYRLDPDIHVVLDCACQALWRGLNPQLSDKKWSTLLGNALMLTNNTGFPGRYNCITGEDKGLPFPRFDQQRATGGAILAGKEINGIVYFETMRPESPKSVAEVLNSPWLWYFATSVGTDGSIRHITRLGEDGKYHPVRIPVITSVQATLPASQLHKLPEGFWPDVTWMHF